MFGVKEREREREREWQGWISFEIDSSKIQLSGAINLPNNIRNVLQGFIKEYVNIFSKSQINACMYSWFMLYMWIISFYL